MASRNKYSSKATVHQAAQKICDGCVAKSRSSYDFTRPRYCKKHQCPTEDMPGILCTIRKKGDETHCSSHYIPSCNMCSSEPLSGSPYCEIHSCSYRGCQKVARPGKGTDFCDDHKCQDADCNFGRKRMEFDGKLQLLQFCQSHECQTMECHAKKYPDKGFCVSHCCNNPGCTGEREGGFIGPVCIKHHEEKIGEQRVKEHETQKAIEERKRTIKEAKEKAEQEKLEAKVRREVVEEQKRKQAKLDKEAREIEKKAKELARDQSPRSYFTNSPRTSGSNIHEPERRKEKVVYVYSDAEAYRSSSSAGAAASKDWYSERVSRVQGDGYRSNYQARNSSSSGSPEGFLRHAQNVADGW